jgi:hypothetical protein
VAYFSPRRAIIMAKKILVALGALGAIALIPLALLAQPGARSTRVSANDPGLKKPDYGTSTGHTATPVFVRRGPMVEARSEFD